MPFFPVSRDNNKAQAALTNEAVVTLLGSFSIPISDVT